MIFLQILLALFGLWLISGTLLNFSKHPHWYIRGWDFPRLFTAGLAAIAGVAYGSFFHQSWWDWLLLAGLVFVILVQIYKVIPYTPIARKMVKDSTRGPGDHRFKLLMSNVLMENEEHEKWLEVVRNADADIVVAVEIDDKWDAAIRPLEQDYPYVVRRPQNNYYGMVLYSRLPFDGEPDVRYIVQEDIPSIHVTLRLRNGQPVRLHAMHPRPPEPLRDQDSAPRDAELVIAGREIAERERTIPTVVCGDLNDVAWSFTTQLFLRLSKLRDPRKGRGLFNSFNANSRIFRFPLDHVFHSDELRLVDLRVLEHVGSDHFPIFIELSSEPEIAHEQGEPVTRPSDHEEADEIIEKQAEREIEGKEHGKVAEKLRNGEDLSSG